jgi:cytochrome P450
MSAPMSAVGFALRLYHGRAAIAYAAYVSKDPMARLQTRPGRANPYAIYDKMRAAGTVVPTRLGNWATTSHRVCNTVLRDRRFGVRRLDSIPSDDELNLSFLEMNPPDHTRLRRLAMPAFSPKAVATYADRITTTVGRLLDTTTRGVPFDLVSTLAAPVPIAVITDLLDIPDSESEDFARLGVVLGGALDGLRSLRHAAALQATEARLRVLFDELFELRRHEPGDDLVSQVVAAEGDRVRPEEMLPLCVLLLLAGFETTVNLIGNAVLALLDHRDQWEALCADPAGMAPRAVDEALRFDPPVQRTARVAFEAIDLDGRSVRPDQLVVTLIGAANRDPEVYDRPHAFDINRVTTADHLAFSGGIHYCIGQPLARLEATIALRTLAERCPGLRRAGPVRRRNATTIRGPIHLPVVYD